MAALFDAISAVTTVGATASSPNTNTFTHTPVGTPACVVFNIEWFLDVLSTGTVTITGVTYGGVAMTNIGSQFVGGVHTVEKWILHGPASGVKTVAVTWQNDDGTSTSQGRCTITSFTSGGTTTNGTVVAATAATSPMTASVVGTSANNILDTVSGVFDGVSAFVTVTVNGTNETKRAGTTNFGASGVRAQFTASTQTSANGTVTPNATLSANRSWGLLSVEIQEVISALPVGGSIAQLIFGK